MKESFSAPLGQHIEDNTHAALVRTVDHWVDDVLGRIARTSLRRKFGYSTGLGISIDLGTPSTWVDIWAHGGLRTPPTSEFTPYAASDDAGDTTNAVFEILDETGHRELVEITLDGLTPVSLGVTATDVLRAYNSGATDFVGTIYCTTANNFSLGVPDNQDEVLVTIGINEGQSQVLAERVPHGRVFLFKSLDLRLVRASGAAGSAILALSIKEPGGVFRDKLPCQISTAGQPPFNMEGMSAPAGSIIQLRARDVSDNISAISATLRYKEVGA